MSADRVTAALALVDGLDGVLAAGFARLVPEQRAALTAFAHGLAGSPLGGTVAAAVDALAAGDPSTHHFVALAAGRAAVLGAVHDALLDEAGVPLVPAAPVAPAPLTLDQKPRLDGLGQWLVEIALAGLGQLDEARVAPILPTLTSVQATPGLTRVAALATGFARELLDHAPTSAMPELPRRRWGDLWSRALLGTVSLPGTVPSVEVRGHLAVLGADVRHHDHLVSVVVHGVFEHDGARSFTRTTLSSWKVDAISGVDLWNLLKPQAPALVAALASPAVLAVSGRLGGGELAIDAVAEATPFDPFALDLSGVAYPPAAPRDRHPIQLAIPARDPGDPLDRSRSVAMLDLADAAADATSVVGLRRWDDGWRLQPLLARTRKGKVLGAATALAAAEKVKADARSVLAERASKLLRA